MKKNLIRCAALILALASIFTFTAFAADSVKGDIDNDNKVTNTDILLVAGFCVGASNLTDDQQAAADVDLDGAVSNTDIIGIARIVVGLEAEESAAGSSLIVKAVGKTEKTEEPEVIETPEVKEEPVEETKAPAKNYTDEDVYWLSHIIYAEAGGESYKGQIAVGNVVLNRVKSSKFPNTIYGVIFQKSQFTPASSGSIYRTPSQSCINAAIAALEGENVVGGALYFNTVGLNSWAARNATFVTRIGNHNFYK